MIGARTIGVSTRPPAVGRRLGRVLGLLAGCLLTIALSLSPAVTRIFSLDGALQPSTLAAFARLQFVILLSVGIMAAAAIGLWYRPGAALVIARWRLAILVPLTGLYLFFGLNQGLNPGEEGHYVYKAMRVLDGDIPHRDYWDAYPPGGAYTMALLFKVFGPHLLVERIYTCSLHFLIVVGTYLVARALAPPAFALGSWLVMAVWIRGWNPGSPMLPASVLVLATCLASMRLLSGGGQRWLATAGVTTGLTTLFRHDIGFYVFAAVGLVTVVHAGASGEGLRPGARRRAVWQAAATYLAGTLAVLLPAGAFFLFQVKGQELLSQLLLFPLLGIRVFRALPWPTPVADVAQLVRGEMAPTTYALVTANWFQLMFPAVTFIASAVPLATDIRQQRGVSSETWRIVLMLSLGLAFLSQMKLRLDTTHMLPAIVPAAVLAAWVVRRLTAMPRRLTGQTLVDGGVTLYLLAVLAAVHFPRLLIFYVIPYSTPLVPLPLERASGILVEANEARDLTAAVRFVQACVPPSREIFVGNIAHDQVFMNHAMFYFLAARHNASRYFILEPGHITTRPVQREVIEDLRWGPVDYVVLWARPQLREPNLSGQSSGVTDLDDFIREHYRPVAGFGEYLIFRRVRGTPAFPQPPPGPCGGEPRSP